MGYGLRPEGAGFICSTYRQDGDKLAQYCQDSIEEMAQVLYFDQMGHPDDGASLRETHT
jgi:hypothetical protein